MASSRQFQGMQKGDSMCCVARVFMEGREDKSGLLQRRGGNNLGNDFVISRRWPSRLSGPFCIPRKRNGTRIVKSAKCLIVLFQ